MLPPETRRTVIATTQTPLVGKFTFDAGDVPAGAIYSVEIDRCTDSAPDIWPDTDANISIDLQASIDGGVTWVAGGGASWNGGVHVSREGQEMPISWFRCAAPKSTGVKLRGKINVSRQVRTNISVAIY